MASMCFPLSTAINNQGITIAIGSILGPKDVVVFSTLRTLSRLALQVMVMIKDATSPEISSAYARNDMIIARKLHRYSCQFSLWLGLIFIALIAFSGKWIIQTWTHGIVKFDFVLLCIMLSSVLISSFWYISIAVLTSTNNHQKAAIWYLIGTLLSLGLAITTLPKFGLNGAAISLAFADIWMLTFVVKNSLILLQDDLSSYLQVILIPPFLKEFNKLFNRI
jgi:O-antigen/teichoic acid export membrane protein